MDLLWKCSEKQLLEMLIEKPQHHPDLLKYFMSSAAFIGEFKKQYPGKQSIVFAEQFVGLTSVVDAERGYNPGFHSSPKTAVRLTELMSIPNELPPIIISVQVEECANTIRTLYSYNLDSKVKELEKIFVGKYAKAPEYGRGNLISFLHR